LITIGLPWPAFNLRPSLLRPRTRPQTFLRKCLPFSIWSVDRYAYAYAYTEAELARALEAVRPQIVTIVLDRFRTKRRNLYVRSDALIGLYSPLALFRSGVIGHGLHEPQEARYIRQVFNDLVQARAFITATDAHGTVLYRTRTKSDPPR